MIKTPSPGRNYSPLLTESPLDLNPTPDYLAATLSDDEDAEQDE